MNKEAVSHINSRYRHEDTYVTPEGNVGIRIRTGFDVDCVWLVYNDPYFYQDGRWKPTSVIMKEIGKTYRGRIYGTEVPCPTRRIKYFFVLKCGDVEYQYSELGFTKGYDIAYLPCFFIPYVDDDMRFEQAEWVKKTVWYQIMPRRFASGNTALDPKLNREDDQNLGVIRGIINKLNYLQELGINGLYLNPIYKAHSYHKYDVIDYQCIDPELGTEEDFIELCNEAHDRNMRVMLDISFTHCSSLNRLWLDVKEKGKKSQYYDWFRIYDDKANGGALNYETFGFQQDMPKFNTECFELIEFFANKVIKYWMHKAGVDAWRIDVANEISDEMFQRVKSVMINEKHDSYMVGEIWHNASEWINETKLDGVTNYALSRAILSYVNSPEHNDWNYKCAITELMYSYSPEQLQGCMGLIDSHDTQRLRTTLKDDKRKFKLSLFLLLTFLGTPSLYYGTERYMEGGSDPDCRRYVDWNDISSDEQEMESFVRLLLKLRRENPELANDGTFEFLDHDELLIIKRQGKNNGFFLVINGQEYEQITKIPIQEGKYYKNIINSDMVSNVVKMEPFGFMILEI